jgi:hypothetical protein
MIEGQGLFNLAARSAANTALARQTASGHHVPDNLFGRSEKKDNPLASLTVDANTTIRAMFQAAWEKVHDDDNQISDDMLKRLEKASKSDNKEIAAERLRQAKAKLRSLRLQAQVAAASGDPKQLKRIAQQAAQAAHEVASAARGLAEGIAASAVSSDGATSAAVPLAATGAPQASTVQQSASREPVALEAKTPDADSSNAGTSSSTDKDAAYLAPTPAGADPIAWGRDQLRQLGDETRAAIAQARGIIAFAAQAARAKRRHGEPEDDSFRTLQQSVNDAAHDLDAALSDATTTLNGGTESSAESALLGGIDGVSAIATTTVAVQVTTEVTVTASLAV